jgi:hypothetical protein
MSKADIVCKYIFLTYLGVVLLYGSYSWILAFMGDDMSILDPYEGRAEMYLDGFHE